MKRSLLLLTGILFACLLIVERIDFDVSQSDKIMVIANEQVLFTAVSLDIEAVKQNKYKFSAEAGPNKIVGTSEAFYFEFESPPILIARLSSNKETVLVEQMQFRKARDALPKIS